MNFKTTPQEFDTISKIAERTNRLIRRLGVPFEGDFISIMMDITACHVNNQPLRLKELLDSDEANFAHDVFGIMRNINRNNGKMENCFVPRFSGRTSLVNG